MFYGMMAWSFVNKNRELLSRIVAILMIVLLAQCFKDLYFIATEINADEKQWMIMTSIDMIVEPLYAFILIELCRPGLLRTKTMVIHELPFILCPTLFAITNAPIFYFIDVIWAAIYGFGYAIWAVITIPKYHQLLKERFSYDDNINLNWLRYILFSFILILALWIIDCLIVDYNIEILYLVSSLIIWMFICNFIYKHESVIGELCEPIASFEDNNSNILKKSILDLFEIQKIYLNPQLKLSDVATMINSNRTYVSRFFNNDYGKTFFEFVNEYRVKYAMILLQTSNEKLELIAEQSGFNSRQSFHRVFSKMLGCTPEQYRQSVKSLTVS